MSSALVYTRIGLIRPPLGAKPWTACHHHNIHSDSSGIIVVLSDLEADSDSVPLHPEHIEAKATHQVTR